MSNEGEKKCPLCAEEMDWTDQQLKPCQCGYEVCVWCWHHIMEMSEKEETEGRCPACRTPYDKERIVGMEANCKRVGASKKDQKSKPQKAKPKKPEVGKDLSGVRVIQRKMAYVIGLPLSLADENLLQRKEFFGQYGKVSKVSLSRTAGGAIQQFVNDTCSAYITYSKEEEAIRCIQSIHGFVLQGSFLRASFGTAKYCHAWLRNLPCTNAACLYLHSIGADEDSFSKDEEAAVHTRNRVHQIVGATHDMQVRSGNTLPPPLDDPLNGNRVDKSTTGSVQKDTAHASQTSGGNLNCSYSSLDKNGRIKTPNKTFVDIVEGSSCGLEKDSSVAEDRKMLNLCAGFSSVGIEGGNHLQTDYSDSVFKKVSSSCHLPTELPRDKDSEEYFVKPFSETSKFSMFETPYFPSSDACTGNGHSFLLSDSERLSFDDQRSKGSDSLSQLSPVLSSSYPIRIPDHSNDHGQQCKERDYTVERRDSPYNSFSNEKITEKLTRLDDNHISNSGDTCALDVVENSIISNILSMKFDSCTDSLTSPHSLAELLDGTGGRHGSWNIRNSDESRFSFAKTGNSVNREPDSSFGSTGQASNKYSSLSKIPQNRVSRAGSSIPPGFSAPSREPPPGFPPRERTTSYVPNGQYHAGPATNIINTRDCHFGDPAIVVVGGKSTSTWNSNSSFETRQAPTTQAYEDEARLWLLMQQSGSNTSSSHQKLRCPAPTGNGFSPVGNNFGLMDPNRSYISHVPQMSQQKYGNTHVPDGYGGVGLDEARLMSAAEIQRNERLGSNQFFPGYGGGDLMFQMSSTGDVYNRVYGL